jgi:general L-amino acid transport system permease protein
MDQGRRAIRPADPLIPSPAPDGALSRLRGRVPAPDDILRYIETKPLEFVLQVALCAVLGLLAFGAIYNAAINLKVGIGFRFLNVTAGFDISQTLIAYSPQTSTNGRAFLVGLLNTLLVAGLGIVCATVLGFAIGIARLSTNFLVERLATAYVELIRNVPLLLQLLFWYNAVLKALPETAASIVLPGGILLNNRGLFTPRPEFADLWQMLAVLGVALLAAAAFNIAVGRTARPRGTLAIRLVGTVALAIAVPVAALVASGGPYTFDYPQLGRYNVEGGKEILPEFVALLLGLSIYTAAFIAEVVRAGLMAVSRGQTEAAQALGLRRMQALRLIVIPQAMRVIIPPLTNQYLNLTKNSSLAVAIGYPDLVQIFAGSVLNITGHAIEVVVITMAVYLTFSLVTSLVMNVYNARSAVVER